MHVIKPDEKLLVDVISIEVEEDDAGLFYATSQDLEGFLVAAPTLAALYDEVPRVLVGLFKERHGYDVYVKRVRTTKVGAPAFAAIPEAHVAAKALESC